MKDEEDDVDQHSTPQVSMFERDRECARILKELQFLNFCYRFQLLQLTLQEYMF